MPVMSARLHNRCRTTLLKCSEFDTDASLRSVFVTDELHLFRDRLPTASNKSERVDRCLAFLLEQRLSDGRPALPIFLSALQDRYQPGDALRDELERLAEDVNRALVSQSLSSVEQSPEPVDTEPVPSSPVEEPSEPSTPALRPPASPGNLWNLLSRYVVPWLAAGGILVVIIAVLFSEPLRCVLEFRLTEGIVALIAVLAVGAGMAFKVAPPRTRTVLQSFYGGAALSLIIVIVVMLFLPPPSQEDCLNGVVTPPAPSSPAVAPIATQVRAKDSSTMVLVPAGRFWMGSDEEDPAAPYDNESPRHQVHLNAFWIDQTEVTNKQYKQCVNTGVCTPPYFPEDLGLAIPAGYYTDTTYGDYPVVYVNWYQAQTYCEWADCRLPTEAEWEYAARGPGSWAFPWGDNFDGTRLNYCDANCPVDWAGSDWVDEDVDDGYAFTAPVGSYPSGESWCGALDMAGNVWEWVADWYWSDYLSDTIATDPQGPASGRFRVIRGGGFDFDWQHARSTTRIEFGASNTDNSTGFRCARYHEEPVATSTPVPVPTPTPTPITVTESLSPSVVIVSPSDGEKVSVRSEVRGQADDLLPDHQLWLLVQASGGNYYPQPGPIEVDSEGTWVASADVGSASQLEWEKPYTITVAIANIEASQEFSSFLNAWPVGWDKGLELPEGCEVLDAATVIRTNPIVTLTSHESHAYVGSHETLKGTYHNMEPGDWLLYGVVELEDERFVPYGPFEPQADSGEWAIDAIFPWPADGSRDVFFHTLAVLTQTLADRTLRSSVGDSLTRADLSATDWNAILGPATQVKLTRAERIAFASDKPGNDDIFVINADGSGLTRLTDNPSDDAEPAWSPDGTRVVFASKRDDAAYQLFVAGIQEGSIEPLIADSMVPGRAPNWSPDGQWIVFHSDRDGNVDIYRVHRDGSELTRVTTDPADDRYPVWSPDGESILFLSERATDDAGLGELYVMDADGGSLARLTQNEASEGHAVWSSDGQQILFTSDRRGGHDIYAMDADGSNARRLADVDYDRHPSFAPDGQRFVFYSSVNNGQLFLASPETEEPLQVQTGLVKSWSPSWSPVNGDERIVFVGRYDGDWEIYSMWDDGTNSVRLMDNDSDEVQARVSPDGRMVAFASKITGNWDIWLEDAQTPAEWVQLTDDTANDWQPTWSPDGRRLAFASDRDGNWNIYVINVNGTGETRLTSDESEDSFPAWSPGGNHRIAFYSERSGGGDIYTMDSSGQNVEALVENPGFDSSPAWCPDGRTLAFASARDHGGTYATEIYLLDLLSGNLDRLTDNDSYDSIPLWSSDGRRIFFTSDRHWGTDDIWVMDANGSNPRNLTEDYRSDIFGGP